MWRRITAAAASLAAALTMTLGLTANAQADTWSGFHCSADGEVCMKVYYHNYSGDIGWDIIQIELECNKNAWQFGWDHPAVDGHHLGVYKNPFTLMDEKWSLGDAASNVDTSDGGGYCYRFVNVNLSMPQADTVAIQWWFTEQKNLQTDKDGYIRINLCDGSDNC